MKSKGALVGAAAVCGLLAVFTVLFMGKVVLALPLFLIAIALGVRATAATASDGALVWQQPRVLAAGIVGVLAAVVLVGVIPGTAERYRGQKQAEERLVEVTSTLESAQYDARGRVVNMSPGAFEMALVQAKYAPESARSAQKSVRIGLAMISGAILVLLACGAVIRQAVRKGRRERPSPPLGTAT